MRRYVGARFRLGTNKVIGIVLFSIAVDLLAAQNDASVTQTPQAGAPGANARAAAQVAPPGVRWVEIRPDTPSERDAFLKERAASQRARPVTAVPPLPEQIVSPPVPRPQ
jgi:hypothetical protein